MIPVLLVSGSAPDEQRIDGFKQGADAYLAKPYAERELRACIGSMLQSARRREEVAAREAREQAEQQALAERAALLESMTDAFYALDHNFRLTYMNQRALDHFGQTREAMLGKLLWDVLPATPGTAFQQEYERAMREQLAGTAEGVVLQRRRLCGSGPRWKIARVRVLRSGAGRNFLCDGRTQN